MTTRRLPFTLLLLLLAPVRLRAAEPFDVVESTIPAMQAAMKEGRVTSRDLVLLSLARIATWEDRLHAVITVNPRALAEADALDSERKAGKVRGPLHGIPVAVKDNIQTADLPTTGGTLAFDGWVPPADATLVKNLRAAGAVILAKTQLTELANWVAASPQPMPNNYNGLNGWGFNPYDARRDPREATFDGRPALNTGGSSSGAGTAASFWAANVGTETSGSILSPSNQSMLVGIKPTVGRISRTGVIPITADQDTPGPMARSVTDAAILLGVLEGTAPDPADPQFAGDPNDFPFYLLPYPTNGLDYGQFAHLPWLQALPEPISTNVWTTWVEVNPVTGNDLGMATGDVVLVETPNGSFEVPVYINPAAPRDVLLIPMGQGHQFYTRYAEKRGVNPFEIVAPQADSSTGALAWAATRARISTVGRKVRIPRFEGSVPAYQLEEFPIIQVTGPSGA